MASSRLAFLAIAGLLAATLAGCAAPDEASIVVLGSSDSTESANLNPGGSSSHSPLAAPPASGNPQERKGYIQASLHQEPNPQNGKLRFAVEGTFMDAHGKNTVPNQLEWMATYTRTADDKKNAVAEEPIPAGQGSALPGLFDVNPDAPGTYTIRAVVHAQGFEDATLSVPLIKRAPAPGRNSHSYEDNTVPSNTTQPPPPQPPGQIQPTLQQTLGNLTAPFRYTLQATFTAANGTTVSPPAINWTASYARIADELGTPIPQPVVQFAAKGTSLPGNFQLSWSTPGTYRVTVTVAAPQFTTAVAQRQAFLAPLPPPPILLQEGGEGGTGPWTLSSGLSPPLFTGYPQIPMPVTASSTWSITSQQARTGQNAWAAPYYSNLQADLISPNLTFPASSPHHITFWLTGGVENNPNIGIDGLHVLIQNATGQQTEIRYVTDDYPVWTKFTIKVPPQFYGQGVQLVFSFQADGGCATNDTFIFNTFQIFGPCDPSSYTGYFIDDIVVT